ncbi:MAG: hypothetical protein R3B84_17615 [Zavarzinella sp.]
MGRFFTLFAVAATLAVTAAADAQTKEYPGFKATRTKKLPLKLDVDFDNVFLRTIITDEIPSLVKDAGGGTIRVKPLPGAGVTLTSRFTIKAKQITLEELMNKLCEDKNWGWYVKNGPAGSQDDGAIFITTNPKEKGYKEGTAPKQ